MTEGATPSPAKAGEGCGEGNEPLPQDGEVARSAGEGSDDWNPSPDLRSTSPASGRGEREGVPPVLVFAVGNPSRGDDAVGPLLAERLLGENLPGVEVLVDFQLQVEHALDLVGRRLVVFVDACVDTDQPFVDREVTASAGFAHTSHALAPAQVLETYRRVRDDTPPPSRLLGIRGTGFDLGAPLSAEAEAACEAAWPYLLQLCREGASTAG